jgi:hypothetical protein
MTANGRNGHSRPAASMQAQAVSNGGSNGVQRELVRETVGVQASASSGPSAGGYAEDIPFPRPPERPMPRQQLTDLDIPTFIRRQMD